MSTHLSTSRHVPRINKRVLELTTYIRPRSEKTKRAYDTKDRAMLFGLQRDLGSYLYSILVTSSLLNVSAKVRSIIILFLHLPHLCIFIFTTFMYFKQFLYFLMIFFYILIFFCNVICTNVHSIICFKVILCVGNFFLMFLYLFLIFSYYLLIFLIFFNFRN